MKGGRRVLYAASSMERIEKRDVSGEPENGQISHELPKRKRGRPPGTRKTVALPEREQVEPHEAGEMLPKVETHEIHEIAEVEFNDERLAYTLDEEKLSPFSSLLRSILRHDRSEIARVAKELEVAENTIYRWMNGSSEPRPVHLRRLPDVLAEHRGHISFAINQTFPGILDIHASGIPEVRKDIYRRVLDLVYTIEEPDTRSWQVSQTLFEYALLHLDAERHGMAVTYASLMQPRNDDHKIHSLREAAMRGSDPWPHSFESKAFLGSMSLAGNAAVFQRMQIWDAADEGSRLTVEVDDFEESACATPVMRGNHLAGVLIFSSTRRGFFHDTMACKAVDEYAHLLATALLDTDFYPYSQLSLRPMPGLKWQRAYISEIYVSRILTYARKYAISRAEAELRVRQELEAQFEEEGHRELGVQGLPL